MYGWCVAHNQHLGRFSLQAIENYIYIYTYIMHSSIRDAWQNAVAAFGPVQSELLTTNANVNYSHCHCLYTSIINGMCGTVMLVKSQFATDASWLSVPSSHFKQANGTDSRILSTAADISHGYVNLCISLSALDFHFFFAFPKSASIIWCCNWMGCCTPSITCNDTLTIMI